MPWGAVAAAGVTAAGSLISGAVNSNAAQSASASQVGYDQQALAFQQGVYNNELTNLQPYVSTGTNALYSLAQLYGVQPSAGPNAATPAAAPTTTTTTTPGSAGGAATAGASGGNYLSAVQQALSAGGDQALPNGYSLVYTQLGSPDNPPTLFVEDSNGNAVGTYNGSSPGEDAAAIANLIAQPMSGSSGPNASGIGISGSGAAAAPTTTTTTTPGYGSQPTYETPLQMAQGGSVSFGGETYANPLTLAANGNITQNGQTYISPLAAQTQGLPGFQAYTQTPAYQFQLQQGNLALNNSSAAQGLALSGAQVQAAQQYGQGLASTNYQNYLNNYTTAYNNAFNNYSTGFNNYLTNYANNYNTYASQLAQLAGFGSNAAALTGSSGNQAATTSLQALQGAGNSTAAGTVGSANAVTSAANSTSSALNNYLTNAQATNAATNGTSYAGGAFSTPASTGTASWLDVS